MTEPQTLSAYFTYCKLQKNLDNKTLKAYQIDLKQFVDFYPNPTTVTRTDMEWCCTIKVDIENSKSQYIEKDKQEATKDGSESTKIQHGI